MQSHNRFDLRGPLELDFLIDKLRNPPADITVHEVLSYMNYYVPYIKNEHNLKIVIANFLNNPTCFGSQDISLDEHYVIIEAFKSITDRKLKVSIPSLGLKLWYNIVLTSLINFANVNIRKNCWKVIPVLSGILLSNGLRDDMYTNYDPIEYYWYFKRWDDKAEQLLKRASYTVFLSPNVDEVYYLCLIGLSLIYKKTDSIETFVPPLASVLVCLLLTNLIFKNSYGIRCYTETLLPKHNSRQNNKGLSVLQRPVVKHLNKLSFFFESQLKELPVEPAFNFHLNETMGQFLLFNREMCFFAHTHLNPKDLFSKTFDDFWFFMKNVLFSEVVLFQGILSRYLTSQAKSPLLSYVNIYRSQPSISLSLQYKELALLILHNLYYLNFILSAVGRGGFENYNYVYYLSLELSYNRSVSSSEFEVLTKYLSADYKEMNLSPLVINNDYVACSKIIFVLGLWENYLNQGERNSRFVKFDVLPFCLNLLDENRYKDKDLIEGAHSVLLKSFSNNDISVSLEEAINYVGTLERQYPKLLSFHQLQIAIETIGKKVLSANDFKGSPESRASIVRTFMDFLFSICDSKMLGLTDNLSSRNFPDNIFSRNNDRSDDGGLSKSMDSHYNEDDINQNKKNPTFREAFIISTMRVLPYIPITSFLENIGRIWHLIEVSNQSEKEYLISSLWGEISENMDLNRSDIAYAWWYERRKMPEDYAGLIKL